MTFLRTSASCVPSNFGTPTRLRSGAAVVVKSTPTNSARQPIETRRAVVVTRPQFSIRKERITRTAMRRWRRLLALAVARRCRLAQQRRVARGLRSDVVVRTGAGDRRRPAAGHAFRLAAGSEQSAIVPANPRAVPVEYVRYALLGLAHHGRPRARADGGAGRRRRSPRWSTARCPTPPSTSSRSIRSSSRPRARTSACARTPATASTSPTPPTGCARDRGAVRLRAARRVRGRGDPGAVADEAFFRDVARRLAPGGVVAINIAEMQAEGRAVARAFAAVLTPFECRRTAVDGNVMLFAADGPARGRPGRDAALAGRLGRARRDRFLAGGAGGAPGGGAACDRLLAPASGRR